MCCVLTVCFVGVPAAVQEGEDGACADDEERKAGDGYGAHRPRRAALLRRAHSASSACSGGQA